MVTLQRYDDGWPDEFQRESERLAAALVGEIKSVEHIGSTAVPGLIAKPVIDIAVQAADYFDSHRFTAALQSLGYQRHSAGPKNHAVYVRENSAGERTHIVHVFSTDQWSACNQRLFRDRLLRDASARRRYAELKVRLAAHSDDGRTYTAGKTELVQELLDQERAERGLPPTLAWDK